MVKPAALAKAESLAGHARYLGVKLDEFAVAVTLGEAYELLDYLAREHPGNKALQDDIRQAHAEADPWPVLANFRLQGLEILRADALH